MAGDPSELESGRPAPHPPTPAKKTRELLETNLMSNMPSPSIFMSRHSMNLPTTIGTGPATRDQPIPSPSPPPSPSPGRAGLASPPILGHPSDQNITITSAQNTPVQANAAQNATLASQTLANQAKEGLVLTTCSDPQTLTTMTPKVLTLRDRATAAAARGDAQDTQHAPARALIDRYTAGTDMPRVQDAFPAAVIANLDLAMLDDWFSNEGMKLLVIPFEDKARDPDLHLEIGRKILTAVVEITAAPKATIAPPVPISGITKPKQMPNTYLAYHLTKTEYDIMMSRHVWSSEAITFRVLPTNPPCPDFLFTIRGFTTLDENHIFNMVSKV